MSMRLIYSDIVCWPIMHTASVTSLPTFPVSGSSYLYDMEIVGTLSLLLNQDLRILEA